MTDPDYEKKLKKFLIPMLRKRSLYWTGRNDAKREARRERGFYECFACKKWFGAKEIEMDHKVPVINVKTSFTTWDAYIHSLFCDKSNFTALCKNCHASKTAVENEVRSMNKKRKKNAK